MKALFSVSFKSLQCTLVVSGACAVDPPSNTKARRTQRPPTRVLKSLIVWLFSEYLPGLCDAHDSSLQQQQVKKCHPMGPGALQRIATEGTEAPKNIH